MKYLITICCCFLMATSFAQDVTIKKDIIYKDGEAYAKMQKSGAIVHDFSVSTLDGEEILAAIHQGDGAVYIITFMGSGAKGQLEGNLAFAKRLAKELVISNIIKDGKLNPAGERRFLLLHPVAGMVEPIVDIPPGRNYRVVPNNENEPAPNIEPPPVITDRENPHRIRNSMVRTSNNQIRQSNFIVGTYKSSTTTTGGNLYQVISIYSPGGTKVAEYTIKDFNAHEGRLVTLKDNKITPLVVKGFNEMDIVDEIAYWLIERYYL